MKSILAAAGLVLAATAMPLVANAQDTMSAPTIIVTGKYQKDWDRGSKLEANGLADLEKAQKDLVRYSADVVDARNKRDSAQAKALNARSKFQTLVSQAMSITDPDRARDYGQDISKFAKAWENYNDRVKSTTRDLERASKKQREAQAKVDKAQAMVDRGRTMKAEAERLSMLNARS